MPIVPAAPVVSAGLAPLWVALGVPVLLGAVALPLEDGSAEAVDAMTVLTMVDGSAELVELTTAVASGSDAVEVMNTVDWGALKTAVLEIGSADDAVLLSS